MGTQVALVASEPITRQAGDWVAVPRNTALIIISEKARTAKSFSSESLSLVHFISHHVILWGQIPGGEVADRVRS